MIGCTPDKDVHIWNSKRAPAAANKLEIKISCGNLALFSFFLVVVVVACFCVRILKTSRHSGQ